METRKSSQGDTAPETESEETTVTVGGVTVPARRPSEELIVSVSMRLRLAGRSSRPEAEFEAVERVLVDVLTAVVPDEDDQARLVDELAGERVTTRDLLSAMLQAGREPANRNERRGGGSVERAPRRARGRRR